MSIPQISEAQLTIITDCVNGTQAFTQLIADKEKDSKEEYANWTRGEQHTQGLVDMGLLEDISGKCTEVLSRMSAAEGRTFKIFEATPIAVAMFKATDKKTVIH
jgi:hypothetical protein